MVKKRVYVFANRCEFTGVACRRAANVDRRGLTVCFKVPHDWAMQVQNGMLGPIPADAESRE
jgi:hypothetical protein